MATKRHVIIGNGAAGISAAEALRSQDPQAHITIVSEEPVPAYSKVLLHYFIDSRIDEKGLFIRSDRFYRDLKIETALGSGVEAILPDEQAVCLADRSRIAFDTLLIASGSRPQIPPVKGVGLDGVSTMWTLADARKISGFLNTGREGIVIGAGFVGMQAADSLVRRGVKVNVVDLAERIMPHILDRQGADLVRQFAEERGISFYLGVQPEGIAADKTGKKILALNDGRTIAADLCIVATGARPNIGFTEHASVGVDRGVRVDEFMRSSHPHIFAAGDAAEVFDRLGGTHRVFALWSTAVEQGRIAGLNMAGRRAAYAGGIDINTTAVLGLPILTVGRTDMDADAADIAVKRFFNPAKKIYRKFIIRDRKLLGAILMGHVDDGGLIGSLIRSGTCLDPAESRYSLGSHRQRLNFLIG